MSAQIWEFLRPPSPCPGLSTFGWPPPPPVRADTRLALFETLQLVNNSHWRVKKLIILILDVHTCVFLLDNFDNSIPKDGVDHEVNVTHRHDWPNKKCKCSEIIICKKKRFHCCYLRNMCSSFLSIKFCCSYSCLKIT